jgi:hypothetical protein
MRKLILLFTTAILVLAFNSCGGIKTSTSGVENQSFLEFNGIPSKYDNGVDVNIDDKTNFKAEVIKFKPNKISTTVYAISSGKHVVTVSYNGTTLYKQQLFLSNQETRKITLP